MRQIEQGRQYVLVLSEAEWKALRVIVQNGSGDSPDHVAADPQVWRRLNSWAWSGSVEEGDGKDD